MDFEIALLIVGGLICIVGIYAVIVSIWLMIKYVSFNRRSNSRGFTGQEIARKILNDNGDKGIIQREHHALKLGYFGAKIYHESADLTDKKCNATGEIRNVEKANEQK